MTQEREREYTWDDLVAAVGQDFSGGEVRVAIEPVERSAIRRFCEPLELDCPLYYDEETARQHGYQGIIAPVSSVASTFTNSGIWKPGDTTRWPTTEPDAPAAQDPGSGAARIPLPMPKTTAGFATDIEIEYFAPVCVGDTLTTKGRKLVSVNLRETRVGYGAFMVFEGEVYNQRGELVAKTRNGSFMYNPGATE